MKGFQHHEEQRVRSYSWNEDFSVLEADLRVDGLTAVSFQVEQSKLGFGCDCRVWKPETHCAHVIGALLTTINLLTPHLFPRRREDPHYLDPLKRMLAGDTTTPPPTPASEPASQAYQDGRTRDRTGGMLRHPSSQQLAKHKPAGKFAIVLENKEGASHIQVQRDGIPSTCYSPQLPKELAPVSYWYPFQAATSAAFVDYLQQYAAHPIAIAGFAR
jgi:hypothetical protein